MVQLDELRTLVTAQERWLPNCAAQLRTSISEQLQVGLIGCKQTILKAPVVNADPYLLWWQCDTQLKDAVDLIIDCAFGQPPYSDTNQIPAPSTCVDVAVRESAYNPLHPQHQLQNADETIYVAFQQRIQIKVADCPIGFCM